MGRWNFLMTAEGFFFNYLVIKPRLLISHWMANTIHLFLPQINRLILNSNLTKSERKKENRAKETVQKRKIKRLCKKPRDSLSITFWIHHNLGTKTNVAKSTRLSCILKGRLVNIGWSSVFQIKTKVNNSWVKSKMH